MTERNQVTHWLRKPLARSENLKIHIVVAPCCIFPPSGGSLLKAVGEAEGVHAALIDDAWYFVFYGVVALGAVFWFGLSRAVPPNMLMAS